MQATKSVVGKLYDGTTSRAIEASLLIEGPYCRVMASGENLSYLIGDVSVSSRIANLPRTLSFPDGKTFETTDNVAIDALFTSSASHLAIWISKAERQWQLIALLLIGLIAAGLALHFVVLPVAAKSIASALPASIPKELSKIAEKSLGKSSKADAIKIRPDDQKELDALLEELKLRFADEKHGLDIKLKVIASDEYGVNALALPDGSIFVTDELITRTSEPRLWRAILLHEIGHIKHRHGMRSLVEKLGTLLFFSTLTGGVESAALPAFLTSNVYSKEHEHEADEFAARELLALGHSPDDLAEALRKLQETKTTPSGSSKILNVLSTHPGVEERQRALKAYTPDPDESQ